jgi:7-carboxy-7-deazaguanine synthase
MNSIYRATEGEGVNIGQPQVFVRFQGCAIGCINCDSMDTWSFEEGSRLELDAVLEQIESEGMGKIRKVSITGGDPLHPKHVPAVLALCQTLKKKGFWVNIEASGFRVVHEIFDIIDFISFDLKTPSTGVRPSLTTLKNFLLQYGRKCQVKSVIENEKDFDFVLKCREELQDSVDLDKFSWCLTPAYNLKEQFSKDRFIQVQKLNEAAGGIFRVIGQQHKWIYGPDESQV